MLFKKTIERIHRLDYLIRLETTGCPAELSKKLGVSERTLFNYLAELKRLNIPIVWSPLKGSYIYSIPGKIRFGFSSEDPQEQANLQNKSFINPGRQETIY